MKAKPGTVYLVGAGPGDPELLTVAAFALLQQAEVVLHDDLVNAAILAVANPQAEIVNVGKRCGTKKITQQQINALMVDHARAGSIVARLKSGDPLVFGRAGEEIRALLAAGVPFRILPGISAAFAAAAAAGFSMTDRGGASRLILESGHHAPSRSDIPTQSRSETHDDAHRATTLVRYMPGADYPRTQQELLQAGWPPATPIVLVSCAGQPSQQICRTTLAALHEVASLPPPTILLIGQSIGVAANSAG